MNTTYGWPFGSVENKPQKGTHNTYFGIPRERDTYASGEGTDPPPQSIIETEKITNGPSAVAAWHRDREEVGVNYSINCRQLGRRHTQKCVTPPHVSIILGRRCHIVSSGLMRFWQKNG